MGKAAWIVGGVLALAAVGGGAWWVLRGKKKGSKGTGFGKFASTAAKAKKKKKGSLHAYQSDGTKGTGGTGKGGLDDLAATGESVAKKAGYSDPTGGHATKVAGAQLEFGKRALKGDVSTGEATLAALNPLTVGAKGVKDLPGGKALDNALSRASDYIPDLW